MVEAFLEAASRREQAYPLHIRPEEKPLEPALPPFSVRAIVEKHGADYIHDGICLTWQQFQDIYYIIRDSLEQHWRGRIRKLERIDAFFSAMPLLTSGSRLRIIAVNLKLSGSLVERSVAACLDAIQAPFE
jgi:hypothetical protein